MTREEMMAEIAELRAVLDSKEISVEAFRRALNLAKEAARLAALKERGDAEG